MRRDFRPRLGNATIRANLRGFCHVAFKTTEAAEKALELNDSNFFGRDILVQMAKTEEQRNAERDERRARERANRPPAAPPTCWFCLSNEKDVHLVVSIAGESFMSMDKGGLVADHCQVVPVEHVPSFAALAPSAAEEVWRYLAAARRCFAAGGGGARRRSGRMARPSRGRWWCSNAISRYVPRVAITVT